MSRPTNFFGAGCACFGVVLGILFSIGITLASPAALTPPWLQALGLSALQFQAVLAVVFLTLAGLALVEDETARNERTSPRPGVES